MVGISEEVASQVFRNRFQGMYSSQEEQLLFRCCEKDFSSVCALFFKDFLLCEKKKEIYECFCINWIFYLGFEEEMFWVDEGEPYALYLHLLEKIKKRIGRKRGRVA